LTLPLFDFQALVRLLRELRGHVTADELAVLRMMYADPAIAWETFPPPAQGLSGANVGQVADGRFSVADGSSLHLQRFIGATGDVIDAHLDDDDPHVSPIKHAAHATHALEYGAWTGLGLGLLTYVFTGDKRAALVVGGLGASGGVYHGAHTPKQSRKVFLLSDVVAAWRRAA
jgi:hypothetical protein